MPDDPDWSALGVFFEKFDRVANGQNRFGGVVGDLAAKFFLKGHNELDRVETVGAEIIDEAGVLGHFVRLDAEMFHDDFFHALANITHRSNLILHRDPSSSLLFCAGPFTASPFTASPFTTSPSTELVLHGTCLQPWVDTESEADVAPCAP